MNTLLGLLDCQRLWTGQSVSPSFQPKVLSRVLRCSSSKQKPTDAYLISHLELRENVLGRQIRPLQRELYLLVDRLPYGYGSGGYTHSRPGANGVAQIFGGGQLSVFQDGTMKKLILNEVAMQALFGVGHGHPGTP